MLTKEYPDHHDATIILQLVIIYVPFLDTVFKVNALDGKSMIMIVIVTFSSIVCIELLKVIFREKGKRVNRETGKQGNG